ncbi:primosomal protein N' [Syntrophotalea acetylenivorans]|uniref:Replication restart protein PriA n=1 Tax=Syntrophotalea acetylenivorans TaxID=1842532 RepID=A0A1L3GNY9_9BACT|nr:primosomal protein N' [Syntrophotalea acetylenivorans]APG27634.1 primosomal protein N' [Syntrophotalea acetylenivorans]
MSDLIARVAVAAPLPQALYYRIPESLSQQARVGARLRVPLGRRQVVGYLLGFTDQPVARLKDVLEVLDREPLFHESMVAFFEWAADYYCHPLGEVIRTALPAGLSGVGKGPKILSESFFTLLLEKEEPRGAKQRAIVDYLRQHGATPLTQLKEQFGDVYGSLKRLVEQGFVTEDKKERNRDPFAAVPLTADCPVEPAEGQLVALQTIEEALAGNDFRPMLLHGVTGSGKTEVYLRAVQQALKLGRKALVLVPEIALTPQLVGRFRARFAAEGARLAVLHSGLSDGERYDTWRTVARGESDIVIGARSAIFAPIENLGIIVVDEEHEGSYKQGDGFRYHARDLALLRGQMLGATVLLGSATPALTTFYRAQQGQSEYLPLADRVMGRPLPTVELVDLSEQRPEGVLAEPLRQALLENLERGEQSLLLLNRRGFAPFLLCVDCGATVRCPNCEITLTYYQQQRVLRCNYCDFSLTPPDTCPVCHGNELAPEGAGTERLEEELAELLPAANIGRMDRDTTLRKGTHQKLIDGMASRRIDVLVGTQMVAKGHDFPGVTLVGVVNADSALNLPDFRSAERAFSLLTQVAGRAGRGEKPGRVLIQTYDPEHYVLSCAAGHDYRSFYDEELVNREMLGYPPFGHLVNCLLAGNDEQRVIAAAEGLADAWQELADGTTVEILGPAPCPLSRLRGKWRRQILLKAPSRSALRHLLNHFKDLRSRVPAGVTATIDVDPIDML